MARFSFSGNKKHKRQNHASHYLPYLINELSDEIEIVEQALSAGQEGQVLTADSAGKAKWSAPVGGSGGVFYDEIVLSNILGEEQNCTTITLLLNGTKITGNAWIIHSYLDEDDRNIVEYKIVEDGAMDMYSGFPGGPPYTLHILGAYGAEVSIDLENAPYVGDPGFPG